MDKRQLYHTNAHQYLLLLIAFCLPFARLVPIFISLLLLNWLIEGDFKNKFNTIFKNKFALLFIGFYVLHLLGLFYTENMNAGLFDIQVKLSLLVFPLILSSRPVNEELKNKIFRALIVGGVCSALTMLSRAIYSYVAFGETNFYYEAFSSFLIHPSYISMYLNVGITWLLINLINNKFEKNGKRISILVILFFSFIIVLLSSKLGLITLVLIFFSLLIYFIIAKKKYMLGIAGILFMLLSGFLILKFVPEIKGRVTRAISAVTSNNADQGEAESTAVRMLVWKAANQVIENNLLIGTGTGDAKDEMMKEYEKDKMTGALAHKLNTHNEFYQVFVSLGIIGFLWLLASLFLPLVNAIKIQDSMYVFFILIIILNFLPESMLETQAGVMFYAFFNSVLCFCSINTVQKMNADKSINNI